MVSPLLRSSLREIRQSMGRYLAILAIVALGVGFFSGLRMAEPNMKVTGADYVARQHLYDYRLLSTLGFTAADVESFSAVDHAAAARGAVSAEFLYDSGGGDVVLMAHSLTPGINTPRLLWGRMPAAPDECLADGRYFTEADLGRVITVSDHNDEDTLELLRCGSYTIVGVGNSPLYLNHERGTASIGSGAVAAFVLIPEAGFDFEAYHEVFLLLDGVGEPYSQPYSDYIDGYTPVLENTAQARGHLRYTDLRDEALAELSDGEAELADGWQEYYDALAELNDGKKEYADGLQEYEDGLAELADGQAQLAAGRRKYNEGKQQAEAQLAAAQAQVEELENKYQASQNELNSVLTQERENELRTAYAEQLTKLTYLQLMLADLQPKINAGTATEEEKQTYHKIAAELQELKNFLDSETEELIGDLLYGIAGTDVLKTISETSRVKFEAAKADTEKQLADALAELQAGSRALARGREELDEAKIELDDAAREIAEGEAELRDGYEELMEAEQELADGYAELADLKEPDIFVLTRGENVSYASFDNDTNIIKAIAVVFPAFFFLVAALVCMTTMKRMVDEQRTQIGVLKALGYANGQVLGKYVLYAGSAAVVGTVAGYALGSTLLPWIIWQVYGIMYGFADMTFTFDPWLALVSFAAAMAASVGVTILSCRAELRRQSAELLRPKAPKAGRRVFLERITPLWRRLSFLQKVSIRNVLRYRSRLVMLLLGIGGCTALLITGFGIQDSVADIANIQYGEITLYDYDLSFREEKTPREAADYLTARGWAASDGLLLHTSAVDVLAPGVTKSATLAVSSAGSMEGFVALRDQNGPVAYPGAGETVLTAGLAESLGLSAGDTVELRDSDLHSITVTVSGVCDNYLGYTAYLAPAAYETMTGAAPVYKTMYIRAAEGTDVYAGGVALADKDAVVSVRLSASNHSMLNDMLSRMVYVVVVVVVFAAALAFVVLYNLTNINISERIREIATIKVLGFTRAETASYIFREIYMLSALGALAGVGLGKALHAYVMAQVRVEGIYFPCRVSVESYLISVALTMVFTVVICLFLRGKLSAVHMAESLKSIE